MKNMPGGVSHQQIPLLIPAFLRGKLDSQRQREVQEHIASCAACARVHREDLELSNAIEQSPRGVEILLTSERRERNRIHVLRLVEANEQGEEADASPPWRAESRHNPRRRHTVLAAGLAAVAVGTVLLLGIPDTAEQYRTVTYQTHSRASAQATGVEGLTYRVVFQPSTGGEDIQQLLLDVGAVVLGEPTATGVYTLAFPPQHPSDEKILLRLRQLPQVALAEKSVHNDQ